MKFNDLKVGDTVYILKAVKTSYNTGKSFFIPQTVIKVMNTQFKLSDGANCMRTTGKVVGSVFDRCYFENSDNSYGRRIIEDQTEEYNNFKEQVEIEKRLRSRLESLSIKLGSNLGLSGVRQVEKLIKQLEAKLKEQY